MCLTSQLWSGYLKNISTASDQLLNNISIVDCIGEYHEERMSIEVSYISGKQCPKFIPV